MTTPYENLANAIVLQAVKDYRDALKRLKKKPQNKAAMADAMECERFFRSPGTGSSRAWTAST